MSDAPTPQTPTDSSRDTGDDLGATYLDGSITTEPGRRVTSTAEHCVIEAQLVAEGKDLDNPAIPGEEIIADVLATLEAKDLEPAWQVCRGDRE